MIDLDFTYAPDKQTEVEADLAAIMTNDRAAHFLNYGSPGTLYVASTAILFRKPDGSVVDMAAGPAYVYGPSFHAAGYEFENSAVNGLAQVMDLPSLSGMSAYGYGASPVALSFERVLFHELAHAVFTQGGSHSWGITDTDGRSVSVSESLAITAENLYYASGPSEYRFGHGYSNTVTAQHGPTGIEMFAGQATPEVAINLGSVTFSSATTFGWITKTFFETGKTVGLNQYGNYVLDQVDYTDGHSLVTTVGGISNLASAASPITAGLMASSATEARISHALAVMDTMERGDPSLYSHAFGRLVGIDQNRILDAKHAIGEKNGFGVDIVGPVSTGSLATARELAIVNDGSVGTIMIGASGFTTISSMDGVTPITPGGHDASTSNDYLVGGAGSDIILAGSGTRAGYANLLHGMGGDDILVGGSANDRLDGGDDDDILVASAGNDHLSGGAGYDTAYYADLLAGVYFGTDGVTKYNGTDALDGIEAIVGTTFEDHFYALGTGMTFWGNGGNDLFVAANGADIFRGGANHRIGTISFAGVTTTDNEINEYGTSLGHVYDRPDIIVGSAQRDIIHGGRAVVYAGDGADEIWIEGTSAYGEAGDDVFRGPFWDSGVTVDGGTGFDTVDLYWGFDPYSKIGIDWRDGHHSLWFSSPGSSNLGATLVSIENFTFNPNGPALSILLPENVANTFTGTNGANDSITGGALADTLSAGGSYLLTPGPHNVIDGGGGNDTIYGATNGNANYDGDRLDGGDGNDTIWGSAGKDIIIGGTGGDYLHGGAGNDSFFDQAGTNYIYGDAGTDTLNLGGWHTSDLVFGSAGTGWRYVAAKNGAFIDYITTVEKIATYDGIINVTYAPSAFRAEAAHADSQHEALADIDGFDFSGFDQVGDPDDVLVPEELSLTGDGMFSLIGDDPSWLQGDKLDLSGFTEPSFHAESARGAALLAQAIAFEGEAGVGDLGFHHGQEADPMGFLAAHYMTPIHQDMLIL